MLDRLRDKLDEWMRAWIVDTTRGSRGCAKVAKYVGGVTLLLALLAYATAWLL